MFMKFSEWIYKRPDYEKSSEEVKIQNLEEPEIYAIRDEINMLVKIQSLQMNLKKNLENRFLLMYPIEKQTKKVRNCNLLNCN